MTDKQAQIKNMFWFVPLMMLLLTVMGNLIMLLLFPDEQFTIKSFLFCSANSILVGGAFMIGISVMVGLLDRKLPWLQYPLKRLVVQFLVTIGFSLSVILLAIIFNGLFIYHEVSGQFFVETGYFMLKIAFSFIFLSTLISNAIMFFKNWKKAAVQHEILKRQQLALQYETLKSQVNPHFLFNNLNSLTSLISTNPDKAIQFVKKLSEVYRYVLDQKDHELVDLATELRFLESYIFLHKIRFESNLDVQIEVKPQNFKVIPLSVQMLVENAIKHNEISDKKPLRIHIFQNENNELIIENQLQKKSGSEGSGTGIQNIRDRYEFFTDRKVIISFNSERFRVSIPLLTD